MRTKLVVAAAGLGSRLWSSQPRRCRRTTRSPPSSTRTSRVTMKGTVTKMEWVNPHVWLHMDVKMPDGKVENWAFEAGTPNVLFRRGFTRKSLLPGTVVVIDGYQAKDGTRRANGRDITFEDGKKLFMGSSGTGAPYELNQKPSTAALKRSAPCLDSSSATSTRSALRCDRTRRASPARRRVRSALTACDR